MLEENKNGEHRPAITHVNVDRRRQHWVLITWAYLLLLGTIIAGIATVINNIGSICENRTTGWRFVSLCAYLAPPPASTKNTPAEPSRTPVAPPSSSIPDTSASDERLRKLRAAAENWQTRSSIDYQDFSEVKAAVNEEDKKRWTDDDRMAWDQLTLAEQLLSWRTKVVTADDAKELPIDVTIVYPEGVPQNFTGRVAAALDSQGFKNVQVTDVTRAAILVSLGPATHRCPPNPAISPNSGDAMGVCSVTVTISAYWIGGVPLFAATDVRGEQPGKTSDDEAMNTAAEKSAAKIAKLVASAVIKH